MSESRAKVLVHTPQGLSGILQRDGDYLFSFAPDAPAETAPALGMPLRAGPYEFPSLHPIFLRQLQPNGRTWMRHAGICNQIMQDRRIDRSDPLLSFDREDG